MKQSPLLQTGKEVSRLGFGAMRLPTEKQGDATVINRAESTKMLHHAIDHGVTYVDTAYTYLDGESEPFLGEALQGGYRKKVQLATKLPPWKVETKKDMDRILDEQLMRMKTDTIDFYLLHALDKSGFEKFQRLEYQDFLDRAVKSGKIRFPSFSFHDDAEVFRTILDDYDWKMTQLQMNILDDENQATMEGLLYAADKGVGIVIMEPLRGGAMANPPAEVQALYDAFPVKRSAVEWAFRYLYDLPQVMTILSGMNTMEQVEDNLRIFEAAVPGTMTQEEKDLLKKVKAAYLSRMKTGCTGCAYCQPCPVGVKIPNIFQGYDNAMMMDRLPGFKNQYAGLEKEKADGGQCVACGACEKACPQQLPVIRYLSEIHQSMA